MQRQGKKSNGFKSGDRGGYDTGHIHLLSNCPLKNLPVIIQRPSITPDGCSCSFVQRSLLNTNWLSVPWKFSVTNGCLRSVYWVQSKQVVSCYSKSHDAFIKTCLILQWYQQPTRCSKICFIGSFDLALHVSDDSFAHLQEHFDCIYSFLEQRTDFAVPKSCIYSQSAPEDGRNCSPKHIEQA